LPAVQKICYQETQNNLDWNNHGHQQKGIGKRFVKKPVMKDLYIIIYAGKAGNIKPVPIVKADKGAENYRKYRKGQKDDEIRGRKKIGGHFLFQQITAPGYFSCHSRILLSLPSQTGGCPGSRLLSGQPF
jgi:hypothetical protein